MSTLILIRHGQASFGSVNYDQLSEKGIRQSEALGAFWAGRGRPLDAVFSGAQQRQKHTLELVRESYVRAGLDFPRSAVNEAFNEYDATAIMTHLYPRLLQQDDQLRQIVESTPALGDASPEGRKAFQKSFEIVLDGWIAGKTEIEGLESWRDFKARVVDGIETIRAGFQTGKTVAVFTSGGAISTAIGYALGISDNKALGLQWVIKNASLTEFIFSGGKLTLTGFNLTPHLAEDSLVTYR